MTAVRKTLLKTLGISVATAALAVFAYGASAQEKKAATPAPAAAKKAPACKTIKAQSGCEARAADCTWVAESKDDKGKVKAKAYCRAKPKEAAKKPEPKKAEPKK
jgi:hypothetical protein